MGFEVEHPPTWHIRSVTGAGHETLLLNETPQVGKPNVSVQFHVQRNINPKGLSIDEWYTDQLKDLQSKSLLKAHAVIGGRAAIRREYEGTLGRNVGFFTTLNKTDMFTISFTQPSNLKQLDPVYEAIVATVRFIN